VTATATPARLTPRWYDLRPHPIQARLWRDTTPSVDGYRRFPVVAAGRRSGKTELLKRRMVLSALSFNLAADGWFVLAAPTHLQAKRLFWRDVKALSPPEFLAGQPSESELTIRYINGAELTVLGMDQPARIEGRILDGLGLDEFDNMKPSAWYEHARPALSSPGREGFCWFTSVPEGRAQLFQLYNYATDSGDPEWSAYWWPSRDILDPREIKAAEAQLDERTFRQEYEASFEDSTGRAYWAFERPYHSVPGLLSLYDSKRPLIVVFDWNVAPGVAGIGQEMDGGPDSPLRDFLQGVGHPQYEKIADAVTVWFDRVWIPHDSNTPAVCRKIAAEYGEHEGDVVTDGDATGTARSTSSTEGPDWQQVRAYLKPVFGKRLKIRHARSNPPQRQRVASMNSRLRSADGKIHMLVDGKKAPEIVRDLEGTQIKPGTAGEIWKKDEDPLTHLSDAIGYYVDRVHGIRRHRAVIHDL
jgi:hypothetical protein